MQNDALSAVDEYREQATKLRRLAQQTRFHDVQTRLRAMADGFDRLADHAEARGNVLAVAD